MDRGYVKLWRKVLDTGILRNHALWAFQSWCMIRATWKPITIWVGGHEVTLEPGQFIFGRKKASEALALSEQKIRTCLKNLERSGFLTIRATNHYSVISVVNWGTYQADGECDQPTDQPTPNQRLTNAQPTLNHKQEGKKERREEEDQNQEAYASWSGSPEAEPDPTPRNGIPYAKIVALLNECAGTSFRPNTPETQRLIKARWNAGFREEDFAKVIKSKCEQWKTDPKMVAYLRPQTLFGTKFEAYLNEHDAEVAHENGNAGCEAVFPGHHTTSGRPGLAGGPDKYAELYRGKS